MYTYDVEIKVVTTHLIRVEAENEGDAREEASLTLGADSVTSYDERIRSVTLVES